MKSKYREQVQSISSTKKLQNRFDILFEHHKYVKEKKNENLEAKLEQVNSNKDFNFDLLRNWLIALSGHRLLSTRRKTKIMFKVLTIHMQIWTFQKPKE